ncbi:hypothetical protein H7F51_01065 [Novosphingobium flavum]|uniref:Metallo-beta-lactamase domain-containing protein n=1 Tax=Novosphingobium flavum TaxID=1778672 RepID=A0A7X1FNL2_9SPHN|nr:hypothetical protein [Novosphingobium flavum]MBC2664101.1 hypothetical protein [Novosphingobium flavum]
MTHRLNALLLALAVLVGLPYYWLVLANPARDVPRYPLTIQALRNLSDEMHGARPTGLTVYYTAWRRLPGNLYAAGSGMKRRQFGVLAWRLDVPGRGPILIDSGTTPTLAQAMDGEAFSADIQAALDRELVGASLILATNERPQHLGGLAALARRPASAMALSRARLNPAQVPGAPSSAGAGWPPTLVLRPAIAGKAPQAVAPGVVVIPTGTPTPGSQMIFVRLASGREYLLPGDVAPYATSYRELRLRSNLLDYGADRAMRTAQMRWLVTLRALRRSAPGLIILPAHDIDWINDPESHIGPIAKGEAAAGTS